MSENTSSAPKTKQNIAPLSIQEILYLCLDKWYIFVISLVICLGAVYLYLLHIPPVYTRTSSILVKDEGKDQGPSEAEMFSEISMFKSGTNINNEIETLMSPDIMKEVIRRLNLTVNYESEGKFHNKTLYGTSLPYTVEFLDILPTESASCKIRINSNSTVELSEFRHSAKGIIPEPPLEVKMNDTVNTPLGKMIVFKNRYYKGPFNDVIQVSKLTSASALNQFLGKLWVSRKNEKASIILLTYNDLSIQRADEILSMIIVVYNENWIKDRNRIAESTSQFIDDRLMVIENELGDVDDDISSFKSTNLMPDVQAAASMYMEQAKQVSSDIKELNNKIYAATSMREYLQNVSTSNQMLPVTTDIADLNLSARINQYNSALMERNSLAMYSSADNPLVAEMDRNLASMRASLISSVDNLLNLLNSQVKSLQEYRGQAATQIASTPLQAKYLLSVERQQKVKESLYLYLLQKREENELSQAFTAYNTRVLTQPGGNDSPTGPHRRKFMIIAFVMGLVIPFIIIFLKEILNTMVRGRGDIEQLSIPFVGEIPLSPNKKKSKKNGANGALIDVKSNSRDVMNEAFRVVRTNLEFMVGRQDQGYVIALTSANPGSGKTYNTFNLALSLVIKDRKAVVVDLDMRKGSLSKYASKPDFGVSNYLAGQTDDIDDIIVKDVQETGLDLIPVGTCPPNPTELLVNGRLETLIEQLKKDYDYIFIDCPPVEIVADASIINQVADMTIFIIRAGMFDRNMLPTVQKYYDEKRYRNMTILLNATDGASRKYGYRYGYRYGYKYGYKYGY